MGSGYCGHPERLWLEMYKHEPWDWILDGQWFADHEHGVRYLSINDLKSFLQKNHRMPVWESVENIARAAGGCPVIDKTRKPQRPVDLRVPVILYRMSEGAVLLADGHHRLFKALHTKEQGLMAVLVEESEVPCYRGCGP